MAENFRRYVQPFWRNTGVFQTDRRADWRMELLCQYHVIVRMRTRDKTEHSDIGNLVHSLSVCGQVTGQIDKKKWNSGLSLNRFTPTGPVVLISVEYKQQ